jgi:hypothetical protein
MGSENSKVPAVLVIVATGIQLDKSRETSIP